MSFEIEPVELLELLELLDRPGPGPWVLDKVPNPPSAALEYPTSYIVHELVYAKEKATLKLLHEHWNCRPVEGIVSDIDGLRGGMTCREGFRVIRKPETVARRLEIP